MYRQSYTNARSRIRRFNVITMRSKDLSI
ncbi:unnamed protein product [Clostridium phage HM2]|nr:unnamed protein product [Clostridium phage HM2]